MLDWPMVVDLQDQLLAASTDMERLVGLLDHAATQLLEEFAGARGHLEQVTVGSAPGGADAQAQEILVAAMREHLSTAVTALQFHDMATQLIGHSVKRIRAVADFLGGRLMMDDGDSPDVEFVTRTCPVAQREMDAGSVELF